jgi:osmotically-inducible protein OsmY
MTALHALGSVCACAMATAVAGYIASGGALAPVSAAVARTLEQTDPPARAGMHSPVEPQRIPGTDLAIAAEARSMLAAVPSLAGHPIDVDCIDGALYLSGMASSPSRRRLAERIAASVPGVARVQNRIFVATSPQYAGWQRGR